MKCNVELSKLAHKIPDYGASGHKHVDIVRQLINAYRTSDILDYGCGKQCLSDALSIPVRGYDPALPGLDAEPEPADIVVCTNVLECIEEQDLDEVLEHINSLTKSTCLFIVATRPALKFFHDGSNLHRTIKPAGWWVRKITDHMDLQQFALSQGADEFMMTCFPKGFSDASFEASLQQTKQEIDSGTKEIVVINKDGTTTRKRGG